MTGTLAARNERITLLLPTARRVVKKLPTDLRKNKEYLRTWEGLREIKAEAMKKWGLTDRTAREYALVVLDLAFEEEE